METVQFSPVRKVLERAKQIERQSGNVVHFEIGEPDFDTPQKISDACIKAIKEKYTHYTANRGTIELREAIANRITDTTGIKYDAQNEILATAGAAEALLDSMLALVDEGDEVIIFTPAFMNYENVTALCGGIIKELPLREMDNYQVDCRILEKTVTNKTRLLIINNPQNPCGAIQTKETLEKIAEIVIKKDLLVISDEIYDAITYDGTKVLSIAALPGMRERTILVNGFSKAYAMTGWRVGYLAGPAELIPAILKVHQYCTCCIPTFIQIALAETMNDCRNEIEDMRAKFERRRNLLIDGLSMVRNLEFTVSKGTFYLFINVKKTGLSGVEFATRLLEEEHVATVPGKGFGKDFSDYIRISFATSEEQISEGIRRIKDFTESLV